MLGLNEYKEKMNNMLNDKSTYTLVNRDPTKNLIYSYTIDVLVKRRILTYKRTYCSDRVLAYGLPKIHKLGVPLRMIISSIDNPYRLANFLHHILHDRIPKLAMASHIENNFKLVQN